MPETPKVFGHRQAARRAGFLLLCLAWISTAAAGVCLPHTHSIDDTGSDHHEFKDHVDDGGHIDGACCILSDDSRRQPILVPGLTPEKPEPVALPARDVAGAAEPSPAAVSVCVRIDPLFPSPPYYLLYSRLLIPAFS